MACSKLKPEEFLENSKDFTKTEVLDLLSNIKMTDDFKIFINKLLNDNYSKIEAYKYVSELDF